MVAIAGCSFGHHYSYAGHDYTMTSTNIEYHRQVIRDLEAKYGVLVDDRRVDRHDASLTADALERDYMPSAEKQLARLRGACQFLRSAGAHAPESSGFTSASEPIHRAAEKVCAREGEMEVEIGRARSAIGEKRKAVEREAAEAEKKKQEEAKRAAKAAEEERWERVVKPLLAHCEGSPSVLKAPRGSVPTEAEKLATETCVGASLTDEEKSECRDRCKAIAILARLQADMKREEQATPTATQDPSPRRSGRLPSTDDKRGAGDRRNSVEDRVRCLETRCEACTTERAIIRWGSPQACLPVFDRCAKACGCTNLGPHVTSLADACR